MQRSWEDLLDELRLLGFSEKFIQAIEDDCPSCDVLCQLMADVSRIVRSVQVTTTTKGIGSSSSPLASPPAVSATPLPIEIINSTDKEGDNGKTSEVELQLTKRITQLEQQNEDLKREIEESCRDYDQQKEAYKCQIEKLHAEVELFRHFSKIQKRHNNNNGDDDQPSKRTLLSNLVISSSPSFFFCSIHTFVCLFQNLAEKFASNDNNNSSDNISNNNNNDNDNNTTNINNNLSHQNTNLSSPASVLKFRVHRDLCHPRPYLV